MSLRGEAAKVGRSPRANAADLAVIVGELGLESPEARLWDRYDQAGLTSHGSRARPRPRGRSWSVTSKPSLEHGRMECPYPPATINASELMRARVLLTAQAPADAGDDVATVFCSQCPSQCCYQ